MATSLSNYLFFLKDILTSATGTGGTFRVSPDLELSTVLETAGQQSRIKLQNGTQIERMIVTATGGVMTIVKRGLKQDFSTEDINLNKTWNDGTIGEITFWPQDLLGSGIADNDFVFNGDVTFNGDLVFNRSARMPIYADATARDTAIPSPANGMIIYNSGIGALQQYVAGAWTNFASGSTVNADTTTAGKVELPTTSEVQSNSQTGGSGAALAISPAQMGQYYPKGDGSDGNVTISSNTSLSRDMHYANLTINSGIILDQNGYAIYVNGTMTNEGKIARNGNNGGNATNTTAGTGAPALNTGTCWPCLWGSNGGTGGEGAGANGANGTSVATSYANVTGVVGGNGGNGGSGIGGTGGSGGASTQGSLYNSVQNLAKILSQFVSPSRWVWAGSAYGWLPSNGGWAGGSGGGSGATGGGGGGSGGQGGHIFIYANAIAGSGTIEAKGGTGGNGGTSAFVWSFTGWGGSGAGGNGGVIVLVYNSGTPWATVVTGGAPWSVWSGTGGGTNGTAGATGQNGLAIITNV